MRAAWDNAKQPAAGKILHHQLGQLAGIVRPTCILSDKGGRREGQRLNNPFGYFQTQRRRSAKSRKKGKLNEQNQTK